MQTAAVIGSEVPVPLLQAVTELPEDALPQRPGASPGRWSCCTRRAGARPGTYTFKHVLTQEVAYGSLLQEQRRALHARIVEALEALAGDRVAEQVERLAYHALRGEVWDKAVTYCQQAAPGPSTTARSTRRSPTSTQALQALAPPRAPRHQGAGHRTPPRSGSSLIALGEYGGASPC